MSFKIPVIRSKWTPLAHPAFAVFVVAVLVRLIVQLARGAFLHPTTWEYESIADSLLSGQGYVFVKDGATYVASDASPLYVVLTAAIYAFTGHSQSVVLVIQALAGGLTAWAAVGIASYLSSPRAGVLAGTLVAFDPALAVYATELHPLTVDALFFTGTTLVALRLNAAQNWRATLRLGLLIGFGALTRPTLLGFVPVFIGWSRTWRNVGLLSVPALALVVGAAVTYGAWPLRNSILLQQIVPSSSESTEWFWRGNNPYATGSSVTADGRTMLQAAPLEFQAKIAAATESERIAVYQDAAFAFIQSDLARAFELYTAKLRSFWAGSDATGREYPPSWTPAYNAWYLCIVALALLGAVAALRSALTRPGAVLVVSNLLIVSATQAMFYVEGRHRFALEPLVLVLSGAGAIQLAKLSGRWSAGYFTERAPWRQTRPLPDDPAA